MTEIIDKLRQELRQHSDEKRRVAARSFFKEKIKLYGVNSNLVKKIAKDYYKEVRHLPKIEIFKMCEKLWIAGHLEETYIACKWSYFLHKLYVPSDFILFENWIEKYVNNWASCDTFCNHTIGEFIEMYPQYIQELKKWAKSENRWMRRASAVSLIVPARRGKFLEDIFEIAGILLLDNDDMVQKGYGWMLKVASETYQNEVFSYVIKNKTIMPRTALRYAIEKMPSELRKKAMEK